MTVDTLSISRRLQTVGATKELAEEQAQILREVVSDQLDSKDYLDARLSGLEQRLTIKIVGILTAVIAIIEFFAR